jgi:hypothetical protein
MNQCELVGVVVLCVRACVCAYDGAVAENGSAGPGFGGELGNSKKSAWRSVWGCSIANSTRATMNCWCSCRHGVQTTHKPSTSPPPIMVGNHHTPHARTRQGSRTSRTYTLKQSLWQLPAQMAQKQQREVVCVSQSGLGERTAADQRTQTEQQE